MLMKNSFDLRFCKSPDTNMTYLFFLLVSQVCNLIGHGVHIPTDLHVKFALAAKNNNPSVKALKERKKKKNCAYAAAVPIMF